MGVVAHACCSPCAARHAYMEGFLDEFFAEWESKE